MPQQVKLANISTIMIATRLMQTHIKEHHITIVVTEWLGTSSLQVRLVYCFTVYKPCKYSHPRPKNGIELATIVILIHP